VLLQPFFNWFCWGCVVSPLFRVCFHLSGSPPHTLFPRVKRSYALCSLVVPFFPLFHFVYFPAALQGSVRFLRFTVFPPAMSFDPSAHPSFPATVRWPSPRPVLHCLSSPASEQAPNHDFCWSPRFSVGSPGSRFCRIDIFLPPDFRFHVWVCLFMVLIDHVPVGRFLQFSGVRFLA